MKFFFSIVLIFFFSGCAQDSEPCEYDITEFDAKILSIEPYQSEDGKQLFHIVIKFSESELAKQNQLLEDLIPRIKGKTDSVFIVRNQIKNGLIFSGTVSEIKSGNCEPLYVSFNHYFKME